MNALVRSPRDERHHHHQRRKTPSFSSSLLDAIYRSIDDSKCRVDHQEEAGESVFYHESTAARTKKQRNANFKRRNALSDEGSLRQAIMIERWVENENRCHSTPSSRLYNSNSSSSDSSSGGVFSSSETESGYIDRSNSKVFTVVQKPKPVRTGGSIRSELEQTPKLEGRLMRTKSKALKMYGDLKKSKQPISPGRRITNFLNSLFNPRNVKNAKRETVEELTSVRKSRSVKDATTCSLSSSFSRSCLSKPPPSRAKLSSNNGGSKRSVRFCPVSVIVDEDSRPCGHKCIYEEDPGLMPTPIVRKIAETTMSKNEFKNKNALNFPLRDFEYEDEYDEDGMSCTSSDLFELDNIGAIGVGGYGEELPVYGTTSLKTHHAIAGGLIL